MCLAAYYAAYLIRFDVLARSDMAAFRATAWWIVLLKLASLFSFKLYRGMWRYTGVHDLLNLLKALAVASALVVFGLLSLYRFEGFSRGVIVVDFLLCVVSLGGYRLGVRVLANSLWGEEAGNGSAARLTKLKRLVVIGAGSAGEKLVREVRENRRLSYDVVGLVDDNLSKLRLTIHGVPVLGPVKNLAAIVQDRSIDELIIAAPSATAAEMRKMVDHCKGAGIPFKTVPGIGELIEGRISVNALREVRYEDLLGRQQVEIDASEIGRYVTGKRVMVTGAAGSIGSELCRQIGGFDPELLLLVDRNESGLFDIEMEFAGKFPRLHVVPVLAALQNFALMQRFFGQYEPHVVFHAAAYKHVPMMELHPWEAVFNNIVATKSLLDLCFRNDVEKCVIVSTDKAVRPSNIMGACKRVTELLSQAYAREYGRRFIAVRFGNVIGSVGSVVPLFRKQIAEGGPLTVTHREMTRFFMTIPEACRLILQAGALGNGGEIFLLKMGTPIRIDALARDMITLSGLKPDEDIRIDYIGLRPGEKLHEELISDGEDIIPTRHEKIVVLASNKIVNLREITKAVSDLAKLASACNVAGIKQRLRTVIHDYAPHPDERPVISVVSPLSREERMEREGRKG